MTAREIFIGAVLMFFMFWIAIYPADPSSTFRKYGRGATGSFVRESARTHDGLGLVDTLWQVTGQFI